jgi:hypothetical protein
MKEIYSSLTYYINNFEQINEIVTPSTGKIFNLGFIGTYFDDLLMDGKRKELSLV